MIVKDVVRYLTLAHQSTITKKRRIPEILGNQIVKDTTTVVDKINGTFCILRILPQVIKI